MISHSQPYDSLLKLSLEVVVGSVVVVVGVVVVGVSISGAVVMCDI